MYAGSTLRVFKYFDAWFGAHQKIDRVARKNLQRLTTQTSFPGLRDILKFEGMDGPDGIKRKNPGKDEPWHFYDPSDETDVKLLGIIEYHRLELIKALKADNKSRSSFEAAWLAHAIVDGLTPAHHYPYEAELSVLRGGAGNETRSSAKDKLLIPGTTLPKQVNNNWKMWGDKGLLATHLAFEWGVAVMSLPLRLAKSRPNKLALAQYDELGLSGYFKQTAADIADLDIYGKFYKTGWTPALSRLVTQELMPKIICAVTLAWHDAAAQAASAKK